MFETYALPLVCLMLNFLAFAACLRFLFSRQGLYWIVPLFLTAFILWPNALRLYAAAALTAPETITYSYMELQPLMVSLLWYAMIVTFHFALKKTIRENHHLEQVKKNLHEARYQMAVETLVHKSKEARRKQYYQKQPALLPQLRAYTPDWAELFDQG